MKSNFVYMGNKAVWGGEMPFGLSTLDRRQHLYAIGKTGSGKTTLIRNMIVQDILAGRGVGVIDPHGDLAEELLTLIPPWRTRHVAYFNPLDTEFPVGFNLVSPHSPAHFLQASGLVSSFKNIWRDSWGPRLEYILYATVSALLECENTSLLGIPRMLSDKAYRLWVTKQIKDPLVRSFWEKEFANYDKRFLVEAISPIQNKVGSLLMASPMRNILGQVKNRIDPAFIMNNQRIFIANLSKGRLGEDKANLLGSVLVSAFQNAAMERAAISEEKRKDFFLFVDEFHNFATDSFASILSEARKYRLCLTLAHQYADQVKEEIRNAVFGNVGSIVSFRVGPNDAKILETEFGEGYKAEHFMSLGNHEVRAKLIQDGVHVEPFFGKTLPPTGKVFGRAESIIRYSRERFGTPRNRVEERIRKWMSQ